MGPTALARAPRLRSVPMTVPFCPGEPVGERGAIRYPVASSHVGWPWLGRASHHSRRPQKTGRALRQQQLGMEGISEAPVIPEE